MSLNCSSIDGNKDVENIQSKYMLVLVMITKIMMMLMAVILMMVIVVGC